MSVSEDEVIRRKLLIDGDGGTDDRRISTLIKHYVKWCTLDPNSEEGSILSQKIEQQLQLCEFTMEKTNSMYYMNKKEQENYEKLNKRIENEISDGYSKISDCKSELTQAKRIRRNRQEYDTLAKVIQEHPSRTDTLDKLADLDKELASLKESKASLDEKLDLRRKQFHVLVSAIHQMQSILNDDDQKDEQPMNEN